MALPFMMPRDEVTEEHYRRLERLLRDLYEVLRALLVGDSSPLPATPLFHHQPPPSPPPPSQGSVSVPSQSRARPFRTSSPDGPRAPLSVPILPPAISVAQVSPVKCMEKVASSMALQLEVSHVNVVQGAGQPRPAPA